MNFKNQDTNLFSYFFIVLISFAFNDEIQSEGTCAYQEESGTVTCQSSPANPKVSTSNKSNKKFILYDVNPGEGFNLRRDVYMRIAGLVRQLIKEKPSVQWVLVLPPWGPLYHWEVSKKESQKPQIKIPWSEFFDTVSLSFYIPVIEFVTFLKEQGPVIDAVFYLQQDDWIEGKEWKEKAVIEKCKKPTPYYKTKDGFGGTYWGFNEMRAKDFHCVTTQGYSSTLKNLVKGELSSVMIDRAEVVLHDNFGDSDYWAARRSMRFASHLRAFGDEFRKNYLNSTDEKDNTFILTDWRDMKTKHGHAKGGPYIGVHLRRRDFVLSRKKQVPSLKSVVKQLKDLQQKLKIDKIFLATDAIQTEVNELQQELPSIVRYVPINGENSIDLEGSVAIVEQWICAHAKYFVGTFESTFSFRIQEEREILGFSPASTFNRLCGDQEERCEQPAKWKIVY